MSENNEATFAGVKIGVYESTGTYSSENIEQFLKRFQLHEALKLIGQLSQEWFFRKKPATEVVNGIPVADYVLAYILEFRQKVIIEK